MQRARCGRKLPLCSTPIRTGLLLASDSNGPAGIRTVELGDAADLAAFNPELTNGSVKPLDHTRDKWTMYFLSPEEIALLRRLKTHPDVIPLARFADVNVGVVTGHNDYFLLSRQDAEARGIGAETRRIVSRSAHLEGLVFSEADWHRNAEAGRPAFLFAPEHAPQPDSPVAAYLDEGERRGVPRGYKCRIRKHWHVVPSQWVPDGFALRQVHAYPKLVLNRAGATATDTVHRVRAKPGVDLGPIVAASLNVLTFAFAEVMGRSYGGGVLTFEPTEAQAFPLPVANLDRLDVDRLDVTLRDEGVDAVLRETSNTLLRDGLGLSKNEVDTLTGVWHKLRDRRIGRR